MKIKSKVNIRQVTNGYIIEVNDQFTKNSLAITPDELRKIVLYGQIIIRDLDLLNHSK